MSGRKQESRTLAILEKRYSKEHKEVFVCGWFALKKWQISSFSSVAFLFVAVALALAIMFNPPNSKLFGYQNLQ